MSTYVPGTQEKDLSKVIMSLQAVGSLGDTNAGNVATNTANIATNTTNIATNTTNITALQLVATHLAAPLTNSLGADVSLGTANTYFDGPSVAQGTIGTWFVSGTVTVIDTTLGAGFDAKLWDGTTVIASASSSTAAANFKQAIPLSGFISAPAGNLKITVKNTGSTSGKILFNSSGNSKDSTITAIRIA